MRGALLVLLAGCSTEQVVVEPDFGLERMLHQPRADAFERTPVFPDGRVLQAPPAGTVPRSRLTGDPGRTQGHVAGAYLTALPMPLSRAVLERGHDRFDIYCAPCHGVLGDGDSVIGINLPLVAPRSLLSAQIRAYPPGRIFRAATEGYGLMPSYASQLDVDDRWAVVAYVQALQLSQSIPLSRLPERTRREAEEALP